MSTIVKSTDEIPEAWGYVLCDDSFLSGWGPAEGKTNVCIFPVDGPFEADVVRQNCLWRSEMKRVRFKQTKPRNPNDDQLFSLFEKTETSLWYRIDGFHPANVNADPSLSREAYE